MALLKTNQAVVAFSLTSEMFVRDKSNSQEISMILQIETFLTTNKLALLFILIQLHELLNEGKPPAST